MVGTSDQHDLELNAARLHICKLNKKPSMLVDLEAIDYDLSIIIPDHVFNKFIVARICFGWYKLTCPYTSVKEEEQEKQVSEPKPESEDDDDATTTNEDTSKLEPEVKEQASPKMKKKRNTHPLVKEETLISESEDEVKQPKKKLAKVKGCQVKKDNILILKPDDTQTSSSSYIKSVVVNNTSGSNSNPPAYRAASQPVKASSGKPKPKPHLVPCKQHQPSPQPLDDEIQIIENKIDARDNIETDANVKDSASLGAGANNKHVNDQGNDEGKGTEMEIDIPKVSETAKSLTLLTDYNNNDNHGACITAAVLSKYSHTTTGASSSSSTYGRGKATKKKAKVTQSNNGEMIIIPGI
ncbi:hypothetical protein EDD22DRAFT_848238 [Suillus occidentalis]|nr:hypothetical protein EDD22DRAFT_848238 [Suillus occidentalis]